MRKGIKNFQANNINLSNRNRGRTERIQITKKNNKKEKKNSNPEKNMKLDKKEKKMMLEYSERKRRVNPTDPNSVL